jgi:ATP/maltotriose-dependent transcriptional regulator MalT
LIEPPQATVRSAGALLEREDDLAAIDRALAAAGGGDGSMLLIEGPPGIGKTSLLGELRRRARALELTVLTARAGELERGVRFGVVRQLLEVPVGSARGTCREELLAGAARLAEPVFDPASLIARDTGDIAHGTLHGLYWLVANLAERRPLVLSVDDVHWADEPSIRFLTHLAYRLTGMPVLVVLACRSGSEQRRPELGPLLLEAQACVIRPLPLQAASVERLVSANLGVDAATLVAACHEATGGNPFLLSELLGEIRRVARPATEIEPDDVRRLGPERIAAKLLLRVGQLDPASPALTRAVAVLGPEARLTTCAQLAELDVRRVRELADELAALAVLERGEPLRFVHPVVRTAIYDDIPAGRRADLHARAARLLADRQADPEQVALHLMATEPAGDPDVVAALRDAARHALAGGAPDTAAALLRRALAEPPDAGTGPLVHFELGTAEHTLGLLTARDHLLEAGVAATDPVIRARALITLAVDTQPDPARQREQLAHYEQAARDVQELDRQLTLQLHGVRLGALLFNLDLPVRFEDEAETYRDLAGETPEECMLLSFAARKVMAGGESMHTVAALAERAAAHPAIQTHGINFWRLNTTVCLVEAERFDTAEHVLTRVLREVERAGSAFGIAGVSWGRALVRHARGDLRGAESDGRAALDSGLPNSPGGRELYRNTLVRAAAIATSLIQALTDSGRYDEADVVLATHGLDRELPPILPMGLILLARARLRAATGHLEAARTDLEELLRRSTAFRGLSPLITFEAPLALVPVRHALGDLDGARELAAATLRAASRVSSRRATGAALRVGGLLRGGAEGLKMLRDAADTLHTSPALLWRAEALVDLGAALRRQDQRTEACDVLRDGMDLAHRCGAVPLADRAAAELRAAGARPRRRVTTGADALTAAERRVAEFAATGMTNKEIAQSLFVTLRTVEMHLSNVYSKLRIESRQVLGQALGERGETVGSVRR